MKSLLIGLVTVCLAGTGLAACDDDMQADGAPHAAGVCWLQGADGAFTAFERDVRNLETCAAHLEAVFQKDKKPVVGAFGGEYIYIDAAQIRAGRSTKVALPLIRPEMRAKIDGFIRDGENASID